jgi:DivIVA domain-containing protein
MASESLERGRLQPVAEDSKIGEGAGPRALAKAVPPHETSVADSVRAAEFPVVLRGYEREAVDRYIAELAALIERLESRQARESVVQRALEEVGEETSAILKQAHETADDITARSRSQAEDRMEVARQEAEAITREAKLEATELKRETEGLQVERANIVEELRRFAADALALADATTERLDPAPPESDLDATLESDVDATLERAVDGSVPERVDSPYDGAEDDMGLDEQDWADEEEPGPPDEEEPGSPTEELVMPSDGGEDEPPPLRR